MAKTVLILGPSGKIGLHFAHAFARHGWEVRPYKRGTDMNSAAQGCDVIVNGLNPPKYHDWATIIPAITTQILGAAKASGATVIVPGNVYVYGDQAGPWAENTPHKPVSRKGEIRKVMEARYRKASEDGTRVIMLHAGDFIDPDSKTDMLGLITLSSLHAGKITATGQRDIKRAYAYLPDLAEVAVQLAELADLPAYADVPVTGLTFSFNDLKGEIEDQTGRKLKVTKFPWWAMTLAAPFWELARELREMRYLQDTPHSLSGTRLAQLLPDFKATPFQEVISRSLAANGVTRS
ncbi:MAG: epimerase [Deltaproteobacteria bacterium]